MGRKEKKIKESPKRVHKGNRIAQAKQIMKGKIEYKNNMWEELEKNDGVK